MSRSDAESEGAPGIGAGYAIFQLSKALIAQENDLDPAARARARERIARWQQVIAHMVQGTAQYGSRTPFADVPSWVTLEVATGGFATGRLQAGGELIEYERELASAIPAIRAGVERLDLNAWHLTDEGVAALQRRLATGDYRIDVPEEAALPTVAWLLGQGRAEEAWVLVETIAPFFDRLRFFPPPAHGLPVSATEVHVIDAGTVRERLATLPAQPRLVVQTRTIENVLPLYDAAVAHFLLTYAEEWPCRTFPDGWHAQAASLCAQFDATIQRDGIATSKSRVAELYAQLAQCARDSNAMTGRQVGRIRQIVGDFVRKHGHPHSESHRRDRAEQRRQVAAPRHHVIAKAVSARLAPYPAHAGISEFTTLSAPITADEAQAFALAEGIELPLALRKRLERCRSGTIAELIESGLITSGDTIARVLPALTAEIRSAGFPDASLRTLYAASYRAFRRRRSLLLLNLESQVTLGELPWIVAIQGARKPLSIAANAARQALVESSALTLSAFPQAIIPNKLLQEFRALAKTAEVDLPFVDEVASDIFMGKFSTKFTVAAKQAARLISGTIYARYYAIDTNSVADLPDRPNSKTGSWWRPTRTEKVRDGLALMCAQRANAELGTWRPSTNGMIIEQQQILTTQNLAPLFSELDLKALLHGRLSRLAQTCFEWVCARQQTRMDDHHARLVMVKNTAYAWRQMVFYLSMLNESEMHSAVHDIEAHFASQPAPFRDRFMPAMLGLRLAADGHQLHQDEPTAEGARVFLGWSDKPHWLLSPQ